MIKVTGAPIDYIMSQLTDDERRTFRSVIYRGHQIMVYRSWNPRQQRWGGQVNGPCCLGTCSGFFRWSAIRDARKYIDEELRLHLGAAVRGLNSPPQSQRGRHFPALVV